LKVLNIIDVINFISFSFFFNFAAVDESHSLFSR
jgi:hypothetical protein